MSYAVSVQTTTATIASYARKMTQSSRPGVEIILHNHSAGKAYTTFDEITGRVNITSSHNVRFDEIRITLEGTTKTFIDNLPTTGTTSRKVAYHNWLKLPMPIRDTDYPQPRVLESGRTYTFPFNVSPTFILDAEHAECRIHSGFCPGSKPMLTQFSVQHSCSTTSTSLFPQCCSRSRPSSTSATSTKYG